MATSKEMTPTTFRKVYRATIKNIDRENRTITAIVSTETKDRYDEVVLMSAYEQRLPDYMKHPILLSSHSYHGLLNQIGQAKEIKTTDKGLEAIFQYYTGEGNQEADWGFNLACKGVAAFSVGFIGHAYYTPEPSPDMSPEALKALPSRVFTDVELLEISQVTVPANQEALQKAFGIPELIESTLEAATKEFVESFKDFNEIEVKPQKEESKTVETPDPNVTIVKMLTDLQLDLKEIKDGISKLSESKIITPEKVVDSKTDEEVPKKPPKKEVVKFVEEIAIEEAKKFNEKIDADELARKEQERLRTEIAINKEVEEDSYITAALGGVLDLDNLISNLSFPSSKAKDEEK